MLIYFLWRITNNFNNNGHNVLHKYLIYLGILTCKNIKRICNCLYHLNWYIKKYLARKLVFIYHQKQHLSVAIWNKKKIVLKVGNPLSNCFKWQAAKKWRNVVAFCKRAYHYKSKHLKIASLNLCWNWFLIHKWKQWLEIVDISHNPKCWICIFTWYFMDLF